MESEDVLLAFEKVNKGASVSVSQVVGGAPFFTVVLEGKEFVCPQGIRVYRGVSRLGKWTLFVRKVGN